MLVGLTGMVIGGLILDFVLKSINDLDKTVEPISSPESNNDSESYPTAVEFDQDDGYVQELLNNGFQLLFGSSTIGPDGFTYSAYIFLDQTFNNSFTQINPNSSKNLLPEPPWRGVNSFFPNETEGCRIVFSRSDGQTNKFIGAFSAPKYPEGSHYPNFPVSCNPVAWPAIGQQFGADEQKMLGINGVWSDINQNGLPEFIVRYNYCENGCLIREYGEGEVSTHFYEIKTKTKVVDISADLPGVFEVRHFVHSKNPLNFYVYDPTKYTCWWCPIETWWIYAWDGERFVDVTPKYADEYIKKGAEIIDSIKKKYGDVFSDTEMLSILSLYEKAGLRDEAIKVFYELTNPLHWPDSGKCWLQFVRALAMDDYKNGRPFRITNWEYVDVYGGKLERELIEFFGSGYESSNYDLSACLNEIHLYATQNAPQP